MPTVPRDWGDPFLEQAREDLRAAWTISASDAPSTFCMLLQMVFEKLAKAAFARNGQVVPRSHRAATRLFAILQRHPAVIPLLEKHPNVQPFVTALEEAHPAIAGQQIPPWPQLEYPWEDVPSGTVLYPARDLHLARRVQNPKDRIAVDCLKFASALAVQLPTILP